MNQITLAATDLKQALAGLSKVVSRKSTLPILQSIRLTRDTEGRVSLSATDLDAFVSYRVNTPQPAQPLDLLLPFEFLNKTSRGATGDVTVVAESKDQAKLRYQVGGTPLEQSVWCNDPGEFPPAPVIVDAPVKLPITFAETIRQAFEVSSEESSRAILQGAYLDVSEPNCHSIISTNGRALFAANTFRFDLKESVNIPRHKFLTWSGFLDGECSIAVKADKTNPSWAQITTGRWNCIIRQIEGNYPNWRMVVPKDTEKWTTIKLTPAAITQILNLSTNLPGDDEANRTLQLRVDQGLQLEGRNRADKEPTCATINGVTVSGKPIVTALNREYLLNALRCGMEEIRINTELDPILFIKPGKRMVVMPVRLNGPAPTPEPETAAATATETEKESVAESPAGVTETRTESPTQPEPQAQPERKTEMTASPQITTTPIVPAIKIAPTTTTSTPAIKTSESEADPVRSALDQIEVLRGHLREALGGLAGLASLIKQVEKENRVSEKEIATVRQTLRSLQGIKI